MPAFAGMTSSRSNPSSLRTPLAREAAVEATVAGASLADPPLAQAPFEREAQASQQRARRDVAGVHLGFDAPDACLLEQVATDRAQRLSRESLAPVLPAQDIADLQARAGRLELEQQHAPKHLCIRETLKDQLLRRARVREVLHAAKPGDAIVGRRPRRVRQELRDLVIAVDLEEIGYVFGADGTDQEARRPEFGDAGEWHGWWAVAQAFCAGSTQRKSSPKRPLPGTGLRIWRLLAGLQHRGDAPANEFTASASLAVMAGSSASDTGLHVHACTRRAGPRALPTSRGDLAA